MRRSRLQPLIALLCALCLLGAQQAAYAHFLGHLGIAAETTAREGGDADHGAANALSSVCTTCAAFAALDSAPPVVITASTVTVAPAIVLPSRRPVIVWARSAPPYAPRAPPAL